MMKGTENSPFPRLHDTPFQMGGVAPELLWDIIVTTEPDDITARPHPDALDEALGVRCNCL